MTQRLSPTDRKTKLLEAALAVAQRDGYDRMTRDAIAVKAGTSPALVSHSLGTMPQLRRTVMRAAVKQGVVAVIAQGLAVKDKHATGAPEALRKQAVELLAAA